jgi:hypothetical protein
VFDLVRYGRAVLLNIPITVTTSRDGAPTRFDGRLGRHDITRTLSEWQAPGEARLYRLQVVSPQGPAVAEVTAYPDGAWKLRRLYR